MEEYIVLYNPTSGGGKGLAIAKKTQKFMPDCSFSYQDITKILDFDDFLNQNQQKAGVILTGGDGTLNHFINSIDCENLKTNIYFFASGSGNDFARDIKLKKLSKPLLINQYLKDLPTANIKGKEYKFVNSVGAGMDGYCCCEVERLRKLNKKRANYIYVAIKALLYAYRPGNIEVTVDGVTHTFKNAWLAPTMNGRYFGGGFMAAPNQDRLNKEHTISVVAMASKNIFYIIAAFLLLLMGKATIMKKVIKVITGHEVSIKLDREAPLEVDGETILGVKEYSVSTKKKVKQII